MFRKRTIQKRSFLLFEVLLCLALILLCFLPLVKPHAQMRHADLKYLEEIQLERISQLAFCCIKERLYEVDYHRWDDLMKEVSGEINDDRLYVFLGKEKRQLTCTYETVSMDHVPKPSLNKEGLLIQVALHFSPTFSDKTFIRTVYLERHLI